jgi:iron complex transport system permease protein
MLLGLAGLGVPGFAFVGALAAMLLVFGLAHGDGSWTQTRLLLTGVVVAAGCGALVAMILTLAPEQKIQGMLFWLMGDLSQAVNPLPALAVLVATLLVAVPFARELNLLARGADQALALGVAVPFLRRIIYIVASLATAVAVTTAGSIGFVGLIVPHLVRPPSATTSACCRPHVLGRRQPAGAGRHRGAPSSRPSVAGRRSARSRGVLYLLNRK